MVRLGQDRGDVLRVRQTNVKDGEVYAVPVEDFIDGAYDPEHYEILSYNDSRMVPKLDKDGNAQAHEDGTPVLVREYEEIADADRAQIVKASAAERAKAKAQPVATSDE